MASAISTISAKRDRASVEGGETWQHAGRSCFRGCRTGLGCCGTFFPDTMVVKRAAGRGQPSAGPPAQLQHMHEGVLYEEKRNNFTYLSVLSCY